MATAVCQVGVLRAAGWASRGLRTPARNALLADSVPGSVYGRAYGFERAMDNLGAILGPLLAIAFVSVLSVRTAILLSVIPGLLAVAAMAYAIAHISRNEAVLAWAFVLAGIGIGLVETAEHAAVARAASPDVRGSAFGLLAGTQSFGNLVASSIAGVLWTLASPTWAFAYLAAWMVVALALASVGNRIGLAT
jgi:predicted MFS family arabinose efflux permease